MTKLLTIPEVAPVLRMSCRRAYELAAEGTLPGVRRLGPRTYRVSAEELDRFITGTTVAKVTA